MKKFNHTKLSIELKPKLVRDRIPELIEQNEPVRAITKKLTSDSDYFSALIGKLNEETEELKLALDKEGNVAEEMCDILEILNAISKAKKIKYSMLEVLREEKRLIRGGFDKRLFLIRKKPR